MSEELILLKKRNLEKHGKYARFNWAYLSFAGLFKNSFGNAVETAFPQNLNFFCYNLI
jgi:hypothetical protein